MNTHPLPLLLPAPRTIEITQGRCRLGDGFPLEIACDDPRVTRAAVEWQARLKPRAVTADRSASTARVRITEDRAVGPQADGYQLTIRPEGVLVVGTSAAGCYYGLQTLGQLGDGSAPPLPCLHIVDYPEFGSRGLLHDVTRGKVPRLDTLKQLVDRLAALKVNQLQLYIEHAFVFDFDPDICDAEHGLTPAEVRELDVYARERFIELVPAVANLGHMGRILSLPRYRHLAEIEATASWEAMSWPQRARGLTLDCLNPESHVLISRMFAEILDAFSSPVVNICGDEPWDLGAGKNAGRLTGEAKAKAYIEHLGRVSALCASRGRRVRFWGDVLRHYPDSLHQLPHDGTILHWGYDDRADYEGTGVFVASGLPTWVCPGTSGWKRTLNAMNLAERNIATFATAGRRHGAAGLLNTDWGDHGHFNPLAASWHGMALGACLGWNADHPLGADFDRRFAHWMWRTDEADGVSLLRTASAIAERCETWRTLWMPCAEVIGEPALPTIEESRAAAEVAHAASCWCEKHRADVRPRDLDLAELELAATFTALSAGKLAKLAVRCRDGPGGDVVDQTPAAWAERIAGAAQEYAEVWHRRNKPSGLRDIEAALRRAADDIRSFMNEQGQ